MSFRDEVEALDARYLDGCQRRDAAAATGGYTEDAVYLAGGSEPARGRAATGAGLAALWSAGVVDRRITVLSAEAEGNLGYAIEEIETSVGKGFALLVLRRDGQGRWAICAEAFVER
jgi:ketosteroid isomerase-like protein